MLTTAREAYVAPDHHTAVQQYEPVLCSLRCMRGTATIITLASDCSICPWHSVVIQQCSRKERAAQAPSRPRHRSGPREQGGGAPETSAREARGVRAHARGKPATRQDAMLAARLARSRGAAAEPRRACGYSRRWQLPDRAIGRFTQRAC